MAIVLLRLMLGAVHKGLRSQRGRRFSSADKRGSLDADRLHFLVQKNSGVFEIYGASAWTNEVEPVRTRGDGSIFRDIVRTSSMDGPLSVLVSKVYFTNLIAIYWTLEWAKLVLRNAHPLNIFDEITLTFDLKLAICKR